MLNNIGLPGLLLIAIVVLVLFGRGKISSLMGEVGKGITAFKRGVKDGSEEIENAGNDRPELPGETARNVTPPVQPVTPAPPVPPAGPVSPTEAANTVETKDKV